ncbi:DUF2357 domain-containing protein [Xanthomonas axonopodis pv. cyamopsidis]|uniref:DUF2357 domain-containing protein n=1 Tax=Xanthomonas axonopodis TaxID=53413 RepID=UPI0035569C30
MADLRCIDQAGAILELRPGTVTAGFRELGIYHFFAPIDGVALYVDEAPVELVKVDGIQGWRWQPGFYAGRVLAELVTVTGQRAAEYWLDVGPDQSKLDADVFTQMLDELYAFDPELLLGTEAAQASIGVSGEVASPLLSYSRLRRYGDALLAGLKGVAKQPLTRLRRERALVPYHRVRRLDAASARTLLRRADTAALLHGEGVSSAGAVPLFDVVHSIDDLDNPANRALAAVLLAVRRRCGQVAEALQDMAAREEEAGTRTPLQPRLARRLEFLSGLAEKLAKLSRMDPFASVSRTEVTAAGLNAISAHPGYARAYRFAWSVLRPGVAGDARNESLWLSPTWEIYERWCFTRIATCLQERYSDLTWEMQHSGARSDCIRLVGKGPGTRIEASLQRCFPSAGAIKSGLQSVSLQLQPDLLIMFESGDDRRMLVLDAKYRTSRQNVLDAMRSAHLYQDALRWDGERAVCSLLLVPRGGGAPWLEEPDFHVAHQVGVHVLAPDSASTALNLLLDRWLPGTCPVP